MSEQSDPWCHRIGELAWAPSPIAVQAVHDWWPCILYPSWSKAMKESGLITDEKDLMLIGCLKSTAVKDLANNCVPKIVALGPGLNGSRFRSMVVVHYLGLDEKPSWGSVKVDCLKQYTLQSCTTLLQNMTEEYAEEDGPPFSCGVQKLYLAMQEASIVMGSPNFNPRIIFEDYNIENSVEFEKFSTGNETWTKDVQDVQCVMEKSDDGTLDGSTQANSQSHNQKFGVGNIMSSISDSDASFSHDTIL
jgi:hypothetical protein